jgi:two-component system nitrate/nitrite response regulator NarL
VLLEFATVSTRKKNVAVQKAIFRLLNASDEPWKRVLCLRKDIRRSTAGQFSRFDGRAATPSFFKIAYCLPTDQEGLMKRHQSFGVIIIGRSALFREGIVRILRAENFRVLASVASFDELSNVVRTQHLLFLIVHISGYFDLAIEQIEMAKEQYPDCRVAIVVDNYSSTEPSLAHHAGAAGYFIGAMSCDALVKSIELVMTGEMVFPPSFLSSVIVGKDNKQCKTMLSREDERAAFVAPDDEATPQLSPRELVILRCLIEGNSNKNIARRIDIAEATVKVHVKAILRKIRVQNRTQAAIWGLNNAFLTQPANSNSLVPLIDASEPLSDSIPLVSTIKRLGAS